MYNILKNIWEKYWMIFLRVESKSEFFKLKLKGNLFSNYKFSHYEQFSSNKLHLCHEWENLRATDI